MNFSLTLLTSLVFGGIVLVGANFRSGSTEQKIYRTINSQLACFRRMNATHTTGCSSGLTGNVGVLYKVDSLEDLKVVVEDGPHSPYVAVMFSDKFNREYMDPIRKSGRVSGVLLLRREQYEKLNKFSMDKTCPNEGYGMYKKPTDPHYCEKWNAEGTGLMQEDFDFPIFLINELDEGKKILDCYEEFNAPKDGKQRDWPLCATQLQSHMLAAVDTVTCVRRTNRESFPPSRICDPMGDMNIWGPLIPRSQAKPYSNNSVIVIAARMDASSMFDKLSPGADTAATGMTALLAVTKHLQKFKERIANSAALENIFIILFNGEAYDYIGSGRVAYDMKRNSFPVKSAANSTLPATLNFEHIKYFIELNQVALDGADKTYYIHSANETEVKDLVKALSTAAGSNISIASTTAGVGLPPSSFQTFRAHANIPGVVITNYDKSFRNKFYNSFHDDENAVGYVYSNGTGFTSDSIQRRIADLSATVARAVISLSLPNEIVTVEPDYETVDELLNCLLSSPNCAFFQEIADDEISQPYPYPMYVGVINNFNHLTTYIKYLLTKFQGTVVPNTTNTNCTGPRSKDKSVMYQAVGHTCYETTVNWTWAYSPAFDLRGKISQPEWDSGLYSTWTESVWQKFSVKIFLKPSWTHDVATLTSGIAVFVVSFALIGWISKKSDVIFPTRPDVVC